MKMKVIVPGSKLIRGISRERKILMGLTPRIAAISISGFALVKAACYTLRHEDCTDPVIRWKPKKSYSNISSFGIFQQRQISLLSLLCVCLVVQWEIRNRVWVRERDKYTWRAFIGCPFIYLTLVLYFGWLRIKKQSVFSENLWWDFFFFEWM